MKILSNLLGTLLLVSLLGCATNPTQPVPAVKDPANSSEVVIIRGKTIFGSRVSANVTVDGFIIANLFTGKFIRIRLDVGQHGIGTIHGDATLNLEPNETYYFLVNVGYAGGFTCHRIDESEAIALIAKSKELILK